MHAGHAGGGGGIDAADQRVRVRASHERGMQHAGKSQIVEKSPLAADEGIVFDPLDRLAYVKGLSHAGFFVRCHADQFGRSRDGGRGACGVAGSARAAALPDVAGIAEVVSTGRW